MKKANPGNESHGLALAEPWGWHVSVHSADVSRLRVQASALIPPAPLPGLPKAELPSRVSGNSVPVAGVAGVCRPHSLHGGRQMAGGRLPEPVPLPARPLPGQEQFLQPRSSSSEARPTLLFPSPPIQGRPITRPRTRWANRAFLPAGQEQAPRPSVWSAKGS